MYHHQLLVPNLTNLSITFEPTESWGAYTTKILEFCPNLTILRVAYNLWEADRNFLDTDRLVVNHNNIEHLVLSCYGAVKFLQINSSSLMKLESCNAHVVFDCTAPKLTQMSLLDVGSRSEEMTSRHEGAERFKLKCNSFPGPLYLSISKEVNLEGNFHHLVFKDRLPEALNVTGEYPLNITILSTNWYGYGEFDYNGWDEFVRLPILDRVHELAVIGYGLDAMNYLQNFRQLRSLLISPKDHYTKIDTKSLVAIKNFSVF
jgi:hypothetical protein